MNRFFKTAARSGRPHGGRAIAAVALLALCTAVPAQASPIRASSTHDTTVVSSDLSAWNKFIGGGLSLWETGHAPPINLQVREAFYQALASTDPTADPWVQYLAWRRDLDPTRFDYYHPVMGPIVGNLLPPTTTTTTSTSTSTTPSAQQITPAPVPEPGTFAIALALFSGGLWFRRRLS